MSCGQLSGDIFYRILHRKQSIFLISLIQVYPWNVLLNVSRHAFALSVVRKLKYQFSISLYSSTALRSCYSLLPPSNFRPRFSST